MLRVRGVVGVIGVRLRVAHECTSSRVVGRRFDTWVHVALRMCMHASVYVYVYVVAQVSASVCTSVEGICPGSKLLERVVGGGMTSVEPPRAAVARLSGLRRSGVVVRLFEVVVRLHAAR